jgi:hypothetical protein
MRVWAFAVLFFGIPLVLHASACGGGCYWAQKNYKVTPPERCVQTNYDVCDATQWVTLKNGCTDPLVIEPIQPDAGAAVTIAPGSSQLISVQRFADAAGHVQIPALLGTTAIVIAYDVVTN